jgi:hypothetical protein
MFGFRTKQPRPIQRADSDRARFAGLCVFPQRKGSRNDCEQSWVYFTRKPVEIGLVQTQMGAIGRRIHFGFDLAGGNDSPPSNIDKAPIESEAQGITQADVDSAVSECCCSKRRRARSRTTFAEEGHYEQGQEEAEDCG